MKHVELYYFLDKVKYIIVLIMRKHIYFDIIYGPL